MWCQITLATFRMRASQDNFTHLCGVQQNGMFVSTLFEKRKPQPPVAKRGPLENDVLKSWHGGSSKCGECFSICHTDEQVKTQHSEDGGAGDYELILHFLAISEVCTYLNLSSN